MERAHVKQSAVTRLSDVKPLGKDDQGILRDLVPWALDPVDDVEASLYMVIDATEITGL